MRTYSLYLSTTGVNKPLSTTNLAQLKWNINWKEIFGNRNVGECRVRVRLISSANASITTANNNGSLRASFQSYTSNSTNGLNLGAIVPNTFFITSTTVSLYLEGDTSMTNGVSMIIPASNSELYITILNSSETLMLNVPNYQIWLYFDVDDENPTTDKSLFNPR